MPGASGSMQAPMLEFASDRRLVRLPALTTVHSHAFQRQMRGLAQRRQERREGRLLDVARPDVRRRSEARPGVDLRDFARRVSRAQERGRLHRRRVSLRPPPTGRHAVRRPHDPERKSDRRGQGAKGVRIALLRVAYHRAGPSREAEPGQRRFCDPDVDQVLRDVDALRSRYAGDPDVRIGLAPHSVRAVPPSWLAPLRDYAETHALPLHMHVAEQARKRPRSACARPERGRSSSSPITACSAHASSRSTRRTSPRTRRVSWARREPSPASARRPSATWATDFPILALCAPRGCDSARASTATCSPTRSTICALSRRTSGCARRRASRSSPFRGHAGGATLARRVTRGGDGVRVRGRGSAGGHRRRAPDVASRRHRSHLLDAIVFSGGPALVRGIE
jgi:formimidoylglutamate deiminase